MLAAIIVLSLLTATAQTNNKIHLSGHIATAYEYNNESNVSTFSIRRAYFMADGQLNKMIEYRFLLDFAVQNSLGKPSLLDTWVRFNLDDAFKLQLGQFKLPVTMQNTISPLDMATINTSQIVKNYLGTRSRGVGLAAMGDLLDRGDFKTIDYFVGIFNGNGLNTDDSDKKKDFAGRVTVNFNKNISLAGSFYKGTLLIKDNYKDNNRLGIGIQYQNDKALLRYEYMQGELEGINSDGFYILASCYATPKLRPVISYDTFRYNRSDNASKAENFVAGFNYYPFDCIILQANYILRHYAESHKENSDMIYLQCVVKF